MAPTIGRSSELETHVSTMDQLKQLLGESGWTNDKITSIFGGLSGVSDPFKERKLSQNELRLLATKLEGLQSKYEQQQVLNQFALGTLFDQVGKNYNFKSAEELCTAIEQRGASYPREYLHQTGSTFLTFFDKGKVISKESFDSLIVGLQGITGTTATDNASRGQLIRNAFNQTPKITQDNQHQLIIDRDSVAIVSDDGSTTGEHIGSGEEVKLTHPLLEKILILGGVKIHLVSVLYNGKTIWISKSDLPTTLQSIPEMAGGQQIERGVTQLSGLSFGEISKSPESLRGEFEKVRKLSGPLQVAGWSVFFTKLHTEGYDVIFGKDTKNIIVRINNDAKGDLPQKVQRQKDIEHQIRTLTESDPGVRKNILMGLLLQEGVFKNYLETNKNTDGSTKKESISVKEFQKYLQDGRTHTLAHISLAAYDDALLKDAADVIPTQGDVDMALRTMIAQLQKDGVIDVNAPVVPPVVPADLRDSFAGNLSLPSSPLVLAGGGFLYGFLSKGKDGKGGGFLGGLKYGFVGILVALFGSMGSDWIKKNLGYDLGFTLGEQKVGLMKLEKKVNDLRAATDKNSRLTTAEIVAVKALVGEFDSKWKNEPSVSPVGPAIGDILDGKWEPVKRLSDSPELDAYESKINLYYLRAGGSIDSAELQKRLRDIDQKLAQDQASSTSGASTSSGAAAPTVAASAAAAPTASAQETQSQKKAGDIIRNNDEFKKLLDPAKLANKTQYKEGMETYITFINKDLSGVKLSVFLKRGNSIFEKDSGLDPSIQVPAGCDPEILKSMLRTYLTGQYISKFKLEEQGNKDAVVNMVNKIRGTDPTLSEAIAKIHQ